MEQNTKPVEGQNDGQETTAALGGTSSFEVALTFRAIQRVQIDSILTVMDAEQILSFDRRYEALSIYQVGMADIVILNKVDLVNEVQLQSVRDYIQRMETCLAVNAPKSETGIYHAHRH